MILRRHMLLTLLALPSCGGLADNVCEPLWFIGDEIVGPHLTIGCF